MQYATKLGALLTAGALVAALPRPAAAQPMKFDIDGYGGVAVPAGALGDIADVGGTVGGGLAWRFAKHFALRGDVEYSLLTDVEQGGFQVYGPMDLLHFNGGFEVNFAPPAYQDNPFTFSMNIGAGATRMESDATSFVPAFEATYLTFNGGAKLGYQVHEHVNLFFRGTAYLIVTDEAETAVFTGTPVAVDAFGTAWSFPLTGGVRITVP